MMNPMADPFTIEVKQSCQRRRRKLVAIDVAGPKTLKRLDPEATG
jgi:hypothetical protein